MSFLIKRPDELARMRAYGSDTRLFKGGGSGQRDATPEERQLWAMQAASIGDQMDANAENRAITMPVFKSTLGWLDQESNKDFRGEANADFMQGLGQGIGATTRNLERFGSTMNPNALGAQMNNLALGTAAGRVNAMNQANDKQWDRKQALFNGVQGMPMQTANAMGNAANNLGSLAGSIGQSSMNAQNQRNGALQGLGQLGAYIGGGFADGGEVRLAGGGYAIDPAQRALSANNWQENMLDPAGVREYFGGKGLASGGPAAGPSSRANQIRNMDFSGAGRGEEIGLGDAFHAVATPLAMQQVGSQFLKPGIQAAGDWMAKQAGTIAGNAMNSMGLTGTQAAAPVRSATGAGLNTAPAASVAAAPGAESASLALDSMAAEGGMMGGYAAPGATEAVFGAAEGGLGAAGAGGAATATEAAIASEAGAGMLAGEAAAATTAGTNFWNPAGWLAAAYLAKDLFAADGGGVPKRGLRRRKDMTRRGGPVRGPGTETSDSIPAWLSDGEYVVNAEAMKDPKLAKQVKAANKKGLERRYGKGAVR